MEREQMTRIVESAYKKYSELKSEITRGFITFNHMKIVSDALHLKELKNEELSDMWNISYNFFDKMLYEFDKNAKIIGLKPYSEETEFVKDTQSAWSEIINEEARKRRREGLM